MIIKTLISLIIAGFSLLPTWFFLIIKNMLDPEGFWQKFVVFGVGVYVLGAMQLLFLILAFCLIFMIYENN